MQKQVKKLQRSNLSTQKIKTVGLKLHPKDLAIIQKRLNNLEYRYPWLSIVCCSFIQLDNAIRGSLSTCCFTKNFRSTFTAKNCLELYVRLEHDLVRKIHTWKAEQRVPKKNSHFTGQKSFLKKGGLSYGTTS